VKTMLKTHFLTPRQSFTKSAPESAPKAYARLFCLGALLAFTVGITANAQDIKLPPTVTLTAYDTGSSGFNIAIAVGKAIKDKQGSDVRVLPAGNDVARLAPLKANRAQASAMGIGAYFAQEGVFEFATREWGPQPLRIMLTVTDCNALPMAVARDTGVKQIKDLKGKRIGFVVGSPALNQNALAVLAFAGLTASDVKIVEFSSNNAMWKGILNNETDAVIGSTISGQAKEVESSPRGLLFPPTPAADKDGWARMNKIAPYYYPHKTTCGAGGLSAQSPVELPNYPYPIFLAYPLQSAEVIYGITKSMIVNYSAYKDATPGAAGLELSRQKLSWVLPYHDGAIQALKEAGVWKAEHDQHQVKAVKRQDTLASAWSEFLKTNPPDNAEALRKAWMTARAGALKNAGLEVIFE
jgi:TRAP transporter TAXI family solute receptor